MALSKPIIAVVGPTGTGKTMLGIAIARQLRTEVISVDSLQCYTDGQIMTAAPTAAEKNQVKHHMVAYLPPDAEPGYEFVQRAVRVADGLHKKGKIPVLVGGSTSLMLPLLFALHGYKTYNTLNGANDAKPESPQYWQTLVIHLDSRNEECLGKKLDARVEDMVARGMVRELKDLYALQKELMRKNGIRDEEVGSMGVWRCIGYKELYPFLLATDTLSNPSPGTLPHGNGNASKLLEKMTEEGEHGERLFREGIDLMKKNTRRYAQLQTKWAESVLLPALMIEGMPVHRFEIPCCSCEEELEGEREFNKRWVDRVEGPAVRLCEAWEVLADLD